MPKFAVESISQFDTKVSVGKLWREERCRYNDFREDITGTNLESELGDLYAIVRKVANGEMLPKTKCRKLKLSSKLEFAGFEAKSDNLRLYFIIDNGYVLVLGGKKGDQDEDIETLEKTIKEYTEFKRGG